MHDDIAHALRREGVRVDDASLAPDAKNTVRVGYLQADLERGNWVGCAKTYLDVAIETVTQIESVARRASSLHESSTRPVSPPAERQPIDVSASRL